MKTWLVQSKNALCTCVRLLSSDSVSVDIQFLICRLLYLMTCADGPCIIDTLMEFDLATALAKVNLDTALVPHLHLLLIK
jgi:hypothetical protein